MGPSVMDLKKVRRLDFLTYALPGILTLLAMVVCLALHAQGPRGWPLGMAAVGLAFLGIWLRVYLLRR